MGALREKMCALGDEFEELGKNVRLLIALLREADEVFWSRTLERGLPKIEARELAGATFVLGCYGGVDTFSDFELAGELAATEPLRHRNLNARLTELRTAAFESAQGIAARRNW